MTTIDEFERGGSDYSLEASSISEFEDDKSDYLLDESSITEFEKDGSECSSDGSFVGAVAEVTTTPSSDDGDAEATKLWHRRLGHVGEKALRNLTKQGLLEKL
ncbi:hypothetical protein PIB30_058781 [Stylosanthes scabra]|uniref:GAG-pre-integrase domain-containing protein n=1 Tax=Stylosanthes scabra TaxID=79078 RepID=A0ABU6VM35_9FABA|nr:hypothetical protein [Stylosanthes scabra]